MDELLAYLEERAGWALFIMDQERCDALACHAKGLGHAQAPAAKSKFLRQLDCIRNVFLGLSLDHVEAISSKTFVEAGEIVLNVHHLLWIRTLTIFWGAYGLLGDLLLDKAMIASKIATQFSVTSSTVLLVAPLTIFFNSLLEEFFYRGFAFGRLVRKHRQLGYWLPAFAFTIQHMLFIYHWATPLPLAMAFVGLLIFALVLEKAYETADSIVAPWMIHILGDVAMMGIAFRLLW